MNASVRNRKTASKKKKIILISFISLMVVCLVSAVLAVVLYNLFTDDIRESVTIEAGDPLPEKKDFLYTDWDWINMDTDLSGVDTLIPCVKEVTFSLGPVEKKSVLTIRDSEAPEGKTHDLTVSKGTVLTPEDFVVSYDDTTDVRLLFVKAPDTETEGEHIVEIALEDMGGNRTELTAKVTVYDPIAAPVIVGANDIRMYEGDNISYKKDVSIEDTLDPSPELTVDNTAVNPDKAGDYPVLYTATDCYGRTSVKKITVHVEEPPENYNDQKLLQELVDGWAGTYISDNMTVVEKSFAIFRWVRLNVPWDNTRTTRDSVEQALRGMHGLPGDCYTHAITCKMLLDAAGVENMMVQRYPGPGQHYWLLIHNDDDYWYHMDPSPIYLNMHVCFFQTDIEVEDFSRRVRYNYYAFDHSKYPATPMTSPVKAVYKNGDYYLQTNEAY